MGAGRDSSTGLWSEFEFEFEFEVYYPNKKYINITIKCEWLTSKG